LTVAGYCDGNIGGVLRLSSITLSAGVDVPRLPIDNFAAKRRKEIEESEEGEEMQSLKWILIAVGVLMVGSAAVSLAPDIRRYARMRAM
jgi:hypothetical protein